MDKPDFSPPIVHSELRWSAIPDFSGRQVRVVCGVTLGGWHVATALTFGMDILSSFSVFVPDPSLEWNPEVLDAEAFESTYEGKYEDLYGYPRQFVIKVKDGWISAIAFFYNADARLSGVFVAHPDDISGGLDEFIPSAPEAA